MDFGAKPYKTIIPEAQEHLLAAFRTLTPRPHSEDSGLDESEKHGHKGAYVMKLGRLTTLGIAIVLFGVVAAFAPSVVLATEDACASEGAVPDPDNIRAGIRLRGATGGARHPCGGRHPRLGGGDSDRRVGWGHPPRDTPTCHHAVAAREATDWGDTDGAGQPLQPARAVPLGQPVDGRDTA